MDVSKLPRMSKTESPANDSAQPASPNQTVPEAGHISYRSPSVAADPVGVGAEVWIGLVVGLLFLALGRTFGAYAAARIAHQPFHTGVMWNAGTLAGSEVDYPDLDGAPIFSDSGFFLFGIALMVASIAQLLSITRLGARRPLGYLALALMTVVTAYNLFVCGKLMAIGVTPILSLLCVAFGGYEVFLAYRLVRPAPALARP